MLFQFLLTKFSKSELFSCLQKVVHMTNYCKRPTDSCQSGESTDQCHMVCFLLIMAKIELPQRHFSKDPMRALFLVLSKFIPDWVYYIKVAHSLTCKCAGIIQLLSLAIFVSFKQYYGTTSVILSSSIFWTPTCSN